MAHCEQKPLKKKIIQTSICNYFTGYKGVSRKVCVDPVYPLKGRGKRRKMNSRKGINDTFSVNSSEVEVTDISLRIKRKPLVQEIFSDNEDEENSKAFVNTSAQNNESNASAVSNQGDLKPTTPKCTSSKTLKQWKTSSSHVCNEDVLYNNNNTPNVDSPSKSCSKSKRCINIIQDIVVNSSIEKNSPVKKEKVETAVEDKKVNYTVLYEMKKFFNNVLNTSSLKCLLNEHDKKVLYTLFNIEKNYQYTCVKLFMYKSSWYSIRKYVEKIGLNMSANEVITMYNCLKENKLVETDYINNEDLFDLLSLLCLKDLRDIERSFKFKILQRTKETIIINLLKHCKTQVTLCNQTTEQILRNRIKEKMGYSVKLSNEVVKALNNIYILNTFTNSNFLRYQDYFKDLNEALPKYEVENFQIFGQDEFSKYVVAIQLRQSVENAVEKKNFENVFSICKAVFSHLKDILQTADEAQDPCIIHGVKHLERFTAQSQYVSILSTSSKHLKSDYYKEVKSWLETLLSQNNCKHRRGGWYCLLSLIYTTYLKDYEQAAKLIISAFSNEKEHLTEVQLHELAFRGTILHRKTYNLPPLYLDQITELSPQPCDRDWPNSFIECKAMRSNESGRKRKYCQEFENGDKVFLNVEQVALEYYRKSGFPNGLHCEGSVICASFCLLFWDIIYETYVKGAFISSVQNAPLDFYTSHFYLNREAIIKKRLDDIRINWRNDELEGFLIDKWTLHSHEHSICVIEKVVERPEDLCQIIQCIGRFTVSKIFERLVKDYRSFHSGIPDLIVWNNELKKAKFVEVKGENDKLSIKQKLWLGYLMDIGAVVELCNVHSIGSKKKKIK